LSTLKLTAASGGGTVALKGPATTTGNAALELTVPGAESGELVTKDSDDSLVNVQGINGGQIGHRNLIINGSQVIDQRNSGTEVNPVVHAKCVTDRFKFDLSQASKVKAQQVADGPTGFTKSLKITSLAATTPGASDYYLLQQNIEGLNSAHLGWGASGAKTVILSFWVKSSLTGTFATAIRNNGFDRTNVQTYAISVANTWEKKTITFTGDTSGTWLTTNGVGLRVGWDLGGGTDFDAASTGSWLATNDFTTSSCTHLVATNAATWQITGVQLELGDYATSYEFKTYQEELAACMRYYETHNHLTTAKTTDGSVTSQWSTITSNDSNTLVVSTGIVYKVPKRVWPTVTLYNPGDTSTAARVNAQGTERTVTATYGGANALTRIYVSGASSGNYVTYNWEADAEL